MDLPLFRILGYVVVAAAVAVGSIFADRALRPERGSTVKTDTVTVERPMREGDVPDASTPSKVTQYKAPDTADTRTDCITVPTWITKSSSTERGGPRTPPSSDTTETPSPDTSSAFNGPAYDIIPTTGGRPNVSVGTQTVRLSTLDPTTGAGTTYEYAVPDWKWRVGTELDAVATRSFVTTTASLQLKRNFDIGAIGVGPSYSAVVTQSGYRAAPGVTISLETTLWSTQ